jgi:hypothetical protein
MSEVALSAPAMSLPRRVVGIFTSPKAVFESLRENPRVLGALLLLCLVSLLAVYPMLPILVEQQTTAMQDKPNMTPETIARTTQFMKISTPVFALLGNVFMVVVLGGIYIFLANILLGGSTTYKRMMAAVAHIGLVNIPSAIIKLPIILKKGTSDVTLSPAAFLPTEQHKTFLYALLSQFDIFYLWMIGLSGVAISVMAGVSTRKAVTGVVILWIVLVPIFALLQTKLGAGAGG